MPSVVSELIVSLDMCARGTKSPGYYGYSGPELDAWLTARSEEPHRNLIGRKTYDMLNALPEQARDDGWRRMTRQAGFLFSRTLDACDWPGLALVHEDVTEHVRELKQGDGTELRVLGSISVMHQLAKAGLLDVLRLIVCPLVLPETGIERLFENMTDMAFSLAASRALDGRILVLDYQPQGRPPRSD
jgi:dihydrofolate reductase